MSLPVVSSVVGKPSEAVVELLTNLLADARAGRITMVAVAMCDEDGHGSHALGWGEDTNLLTLVGAIARMQFGLIQRHTSSPG